MVSKTFSDASHQTLIFELGYTAPERPSMVIMVCFSSILYTMLLFGLWQLVSWRGQFFGLLTSGDHSLLSAVGDTGGYYDTDLDTLPSQAFHTLTHDATNDIDTLTSLVVSSAWAQAYLEPILRWLFLP